MCRRYTIRKRCIVVVDRGVGTILVLGAEAGSEERCTPLQRWRGLRRGNWAGQYFLKLHPMGFTTLSFLRTPLVVKDFIIWHIHWVHCHTSVIWFGACSTVAILLPWAFNTWRAVAIIWSVLEARALNQKLNTHSLRIRPYTLRLEIPKFACRVTSPT